jgi:hypothetical protein
LDAHGFELHKGVTSLGGEQGRVCGREDYVWKCCCWGGSLLNDLFCRLFLLCWKVMVMEMGRHSTVAPSTTDSTTKFRAFGVLRGASKCQTGSILELFSIEHLQLLFLPPRTRWHATASPAKWLQFLFRKHFQHILQ